MSNILLDSETQTGGQTKSRERQRGRQDRPILSETEKQRDRGTKSQRDRQDRETRDRQIYCRISYLIAPNF